MNNIFTHKHRSGFTLIENIIAFVILTISILAASNLLSNSIKQSEQNTLRLQAYLLAEQGLEGARNIRDSQWMQNIPFEEHQTELWGGENFYPQNTKRTIAINPIYNASTTVKATAWEILPSNQNQLYENDTLGFTRYTHSFSDTESPFTRTITLSKEFPDLNKLIEINEAQQSFDSQNNIEDNLLLVTSTVTYDFRGHPKEFSLQTILTDWKEGPL